MNLKIPAGKYVVAVSGGVDSMVLLHLLTSKPNVDVIVAHFNHGMRADAAADERLVADITSKYAYEFVSAAGNLEADASESKARQARYEFLREVREHHQATAIITAHHQDDVLETAIINLSRGTGWRGLVALGNTAELLRPLLNVSKVEILSYANEHDLAWHEDGTNNDQKYLRNYIRHAVLPKLTTTQRAEFLEIIAAIRITGEALDAAITETLKELTTGNELQRQPIKNLEQPEIKELLIGWWRLNDFNSYESATLNRAVRNIKAPRSGQIVPLKGNLQLTVGRTLLALNKRER